uniref:Uncharacterized protein n=1 Tax=Arundo donax TaxID=35708 RepID=A0A0A9FFL8_ARUDO
MLWPGFYALRLYKFFWRGVLVRVIRRER